MNAYHNLESGLYAANNLYQEHTAGIHFVISKNSVQPYTFKTPGPFYSTGNFDQSIIEKQPVSKTFMSCGNFQTSSRQEEGWDLGEQAKEDFQLPVSKYGNYTLEHSSANVKYNYQYQFTRSHSHEQVDQAGPVHQIIVQNIILAKPSKVDSPSIVNAEPLRFVETSPSGQSKIKLKDVGYQVNKCMDDDNSSNNEYELDSDDGRNGKNNNITKKVHIISENKSNIQSHNNNSKSKTNNSPVGQYYSYVESPRLGS